MKFLRKYANNTIFGNFSSKQRRKRFQFFIDRLKLLNIAEPKILDVGGNTIFWEMLNEYFKTNFKPIIINLRKSELGEGNFIKIVGDGKSLDCLKERSFDIAFSNSVMEHIPDLTNQKIMASSLKQIARFYFIQTPAFIFPVEPHFLFPAFHWLPVCLRIKLIQNFNLGWYSKLHDHQKAKELVNSIRILKKRELKKIFLISEIYRERFLFFTKSYIVTNL